MKYSAMKYNQQKKMFYLQLFIAMVLIGYNTVKLILQGYHPGTVDIPLAFAVGVLMPLSGYISLRRARAEELRNSEPAAGEIAPDTKER